MPRLLKTGVTLALTFTALAHAPQTAQAQSKSKSKSPVLQFGVPLVGPAPISAVPVPDVCWSPGTSAATIAAFERKHIDNGFATSLSPYRTIGQGRWRATATNGAGLTQGQPTTLRYSIVPDGTPITGFNGEPDAPSNLQARLTQIYGSKATWLALFARVGDALSAQSGLTYIYEPNDDGALFGPNANGDQSPGVIGTRGDVRVSGHTIDGEGGPGGSILAYNFEPAGGGDMVIDTADSFYEDRQQADLGFRNVITHEFGHGVGLGHTCPLNESKLMEPFISFNFDGPQFDDIRGLQRFYGDSSEDDDTAATATNLGALMDGTLNVTPTKVLSIDDAGDADFFSFSAPANKSLSITLAPFGDVYFEGPQNSDGSCSAGSRLDPKTINDLGFDLLQADANGNFVSVASVNTAPIGGTEVLVPTNFLEGGQFQLRVSGGDVRDVQTYSLQIAVAAPVVGPTPGPVPTATPMAGPTPTPGPTPVPGPTPIRPVVDLNGPDVTTDAGQGLPYPANVDNTAVYLYARKGIGADGKVGTAGPGKAQLITPDATIVISDITRNGSTTAASIVEARVELTPEDGCFTPPANPQLSDGVAPDNCNPQGKRDNEVLGLNAEVLKAVNRQFQGANISGSYNNTTQILTIKGGVRGDNCGGRNCPDFNRGAFEAALGAVTYENKLPVSGDSPFNRNPSTADRLITYVVDTDNDDSNNVDSTTVPQDPARSNPKQSKPASLILKFQESPNVIVTKESASIIVTTTQDSSPDDEFSRRDDVTSLREAITFANSIPFSVPDKDDTKPDIVSPPTIITFQRVNPNTPKTPLSPLNGTFNVFAPLPAIDAATDLTIQGNGARNVIIDGSGSGGSIFEVNTDATINDLTVQGGEAAVDPFGNSAFGGGILANAGSSVTINRSAIRGSSADFGGGIANVGGSLTVSNSEISENTAANGGGVYLDNSANGGTGQARFFNTTISSNEGAGVAHVSGRASLSLVTIGSNTVGYAVSGTANATIDNTILSKNTTADATRADAGRYTSGGYNIVSTGNAATPANFNGPMDKLLVSARLATLAYNPPNAPTRTHNFFKGSPARNGGNPSYVTPPETDQPGQPRIALGGLDVGAFEKQTDAPVVSVNITPEAPTTNVTIRANAASDLQAGDPPLNFRWTRLVREVIVFSDGSTGTFTRTVTIQNGPSPDLDLSGSFTYVKFNGETVTANNGDRDDIINVTVTATNAAGETGTATDSVTVANSAPSIAPTLIVTNPAPNAGSQEVLTNSVLKVNPNPSDPDTADVTALNYRYEWKVNDVVRPGEIGDTYDLSRAGNGDRGDKITVTVTADDSNGNSFGQTVTAPPISRVVGNTAPVAQNVAFDVNRGQMVRILLTATDADTRQPNPNDPTDKGVDTRFLFKITSAPTQGTATIETNADGRSVLVYTANANATVPDTIQFTATDTATLTNGTLTTGPDAKTSAPATATARIAGTTPTPTPTPGPTPNPDSNRPPSGATFSFSVQREVPVVKSIALSDPDFEDTYGTLNIIRLPNGLRKGAGEIRKDTDGVWKLFYKASRLFQGNDQVQYVVVDRKGAQSAPATITINIINTKPTAISTKMTVAAGAADDIPIFGQDADNDELTFLRVGGPSKGNGEIRRDANGIWRFFYQNNPAAVGNDLVQFVASDGKPGGKSEIATIEIVVVGVFNRAPSAQNVSGTTTANTPVAVAVEGSDPDEDDVLTFKRVGGPTNGTGEIRRDVDGTFKMFYTPAKDFVGTETIRYVAFDQKNKPSAPATITITVTASAPSAGSAIKSNPSPSAGSS